jgi:hypothetical protein
LTKYWKKKLHTWEKNLVALGRYHDIHGVQCSRRNWTLEKYGEVALRSFLTWC